MGGTVDILAAGVPAGSDFDVFAPQGLALDTEFVYWGEEVGGAAIRRVPKAGGTVVDIGRGQNFKPTSIVVDASFIYIAEANLAGRILRIPLGGGSLLDLAALPALVKDYDLSAPFQFTDSSFLNFEWEGTEPQGSYTLFLAVVEAGGFSDGSADAEDIVALVTLVISFTQQQ